MAGWAKTDGEEYRNRHGSQLLAFWRSAFRAMPGHGQRRRISPPAPVPAATGRGARLCPGAAAAPQASFAAAPEPPATTVRTALPAAPGATLAPSPVPSPVLPPAPSPVLPPALSRTTRSPVFGSLVGSPCKA